MPESEARSAATERCGVHVDPGADYPHPCTLLKGHDGEHDGRSKEQRRADARSAAQRHEDDTYAAAAMVTGNYRPPRRSRFYARRERDPYTKAISLVITHGLGTHVRLTLWWWSISWHRRDLELERRLHAEIEVQEAERLNREQAHTGGMLDV